MAELRFEVAGFPPVKNEAQSMLSPGHSQVTRVLALLDAARAAADRAGFEPLLGSIGLSVVIFAPNGSESSGDVTNFLGGIGDVLEEKSRRGSLAHLGELAGVYLYVNDRQIREVHYHQATSESPYYRVRIWSLDRSPESRRMQALLGRITTHPDLLGGKPTIRGRRLAVEHVLGQLAAGDTPELLMAGHSWLEPEDIQACLAFALREVVGPRFPAEDD